MSEARVIPIVPLGAAQAEVERVLTICNACRYCEGFCAVFPAMTRRLSFPAADVDYLANLCHNCGACLHACQYAAPHEFAVNVPQAMARVRGETYADHAWPAALGALYKRNGLVLSLALAAGLALFLLLAVARQGSLWQAVEGGNFYAVFPHGLMVSLFAPVFLFVVFALAMAVRRFWRGISPGAASAEAVGEAAHDALRLRYLDGGHGEGCNEADDRYTLARRRFHHFTFYGFMLCFAATCMATLYHYLLGWQAPYGVTSIPKLLGISGGVSLVIGTLGLWRLNVKRHPAQGDAAQRPMDRGFIALLFLTAASGLVLMLLRGTPALPLALCVHLGAVMALFLTLPYGKFAHGVFRVAALLKWAIEKRQPNTLGVGE
ncbi:tricarballylate utilization 4Fe-4S protein TcuB [Piscinibacter gummiphilus]|uniref:Tricarballylate utilization 4Fe-4S protein TcuB n=1 Tax=Piscinibacter gummiphilus TaxID=946333 RepID=A0ABZ0CX06_9BURK|nr:tricarballylate utilization 4Fe-4S protein TcuB [Piscinibacter gummiphilus]WOB09517.1 tricarballylate utilization 4Fe-4S protein TcuB [Piscinibacter gummiphilus]